MINNKELFKEVQKLLGKEKITQEDLLSIQEIELFKDVNLKSLKGIDCLKNLKKIFYNGLRKLDKDIV